MKKSNINTSSMNLAISQFNPPLSGHNNKQITNMKIMSNHKKIKNQLKWINKSRQSTPYRLEIKRISNIGNVQKKSNSSNLYISFTIKMFLKRKRYELNCQVQQLGGEVQYQCQQPLQRKDESVYNFPTCFYYHSRVNKQQQSIYMAVTVNIVQLSAGIVENRTNLGFFIIQNPFTQTTDKLTLSKHRLFELQYVEFTSYQQMCKSSQGPGVEIQISSAIEIKKLNKLIPENTIVSCDSYIVGLNDQYLENEHEIIEVVETSSVNLNIKYLQVHIPQNFDDQILRLIKTFPNSIFTAKDELKGRKIVMNYIAGGYGICPLQRKLEYIDREQAGELKILIYQGVKDGETINYPYYMDDYSHPINFSLVYEIADKQFQVAVFTLTPLINGSTQQISEQMTTSFNDDHINVKPYRLKVSSKNKPTLITQYISEQILMQDQSIIDEINNKSTPGRKMMRSSQNMLRTSQRLFQDKAQQQRQKQKLIQEIQYEKVSLEKERSQIQKIKNQNYVLYREEFEKRFQQEKQALNKRQEMLERQYREQVEREIREKQQLQEQIREMKEKVKRIEEQGTQVRKNEYYSDDDGLNNPVQSNQFVNSNNQAMTPFPFGNQIFPNRTPYHQSINQRQGPPLQLKQKIDPRYLLETQNSIPVTKVRQIIHKKAKTSINKDMIELSNSQFDKSSVFKFTFTSVLWSSETTRPKQIYFLIRFFNFPEYKTDRVAVFGQDSESGYQQLVRLHQHHYGSQDPTPIYTFTVDPSQYRNPKLLQTDLTSYLTHNNCIVDIFDGQTHIYLGQINIKLTELIRGNKIQTFIAKQYNLINLKTKQHLGSMQILVKNEESQCKNELFSAKPQTATRENKKKVISYMPMQVPKNEKPVNSLNSMQRIKQTTQKNQSSKNRLQQRINQFKQKQKQKKLQDNSNNFILLPEKDKSNVLARIAQHKQKNINQYIKSVYSTLLHEAITISAQFGKAQSFPYTFVNQGTSSSVYKIVIDQQNSSSQQIDSNSTNNNNNNNHIIADLQVVKDIGQWRYLVKRKQVIC